VLRALASPNLDIRRKTLDIALDLITSRNIDEVRPAMLLLGQTGHACVVWLADEWGPAAHLANYMPVHQATHCPHLI
jgi:hypothetical protein